jgi:hypothetical protein
MRKLIGLFLAITMASSGNAKPREVRQLAPSSQWVVNWAEQSCSMARAFGEGDRKVIMFFDQFEPGDDFSLMIIGKSIGDVTGQSKAILQFGPNEERYGVTAVGATSKDTPALIFQGTQRLVPPTEVEKSERKRAAQESLPYQPAPIGAAREKAVTWLWLGKVLRFDLQLDIGPMDAPMAALRDCSWDMVKSWGLDVEQQKHLTARAYPTVPPYNWFTAADYPPEMLRSGNQAIVNFRILVDAAGHASSCVIQTSTRPKAFDDVVCQKVLKRARFHPALGADGKPVPSYWRQSVIFRMAT